MMRVHAISKGDNGKRMAIPPTPAVFLRRKIAITSWASAWAFAHERQLFCTARVVLALPFSL